MIQLQLCAASKETYFKCNAEDWLNVKRLKKIYHVMVIK